MIMIYSLLESLVEVKSF